MTQDKIEAYEAQVLSMIKTVEGYRDQTVGMIAARFQPEIERAQQNGWPTAGDLHRKMMLTIERATRPHVKELARLYALMPIRIVIQKAE